MIECETKDSALLEHMRSPAAGELTNARDTMEFIELLQNIGLILFSGFLLDQAIASAFDKLSKTLLAESTATEECDAVNEESHDLPMVENV